MNKEKKVTGVGFSSYKNLGDLWPEYFHNPNPAVVIATEGVELPLTGIFQMGKLVSLTEKQIWFIKCAIEAKYAVLPLLPTQLDANILGEDYGVSQNEIEKELNDLKIKLL